MAQISDKKRWRILLFAGGIVLGLGLLMIGQGISIHLESSASSDWPTVKGVITVSEVIKDTKIKSISKHGVGPSKRTETTTKKIDIFIPNIVYTYKVDSITYESDILSFFDEIWEDREFAEEETAVYPVGMEVTVYYNPEKHAQAVIEPGSSPALILQFVLGFLMSGFGAIPLVVRHMEMKKEKARNA